MMYAAEYRVLLNTDDESEADEMAEKIAAAIHEVLVAEGGEWVSSETYTC